MAYIKGQGAECPQLISSRKVKNGRPKTKMHVLFIRKSLFCLSFNFLLNFCCYKVHIYSTNNRLPLKCTENLAPLPSPHFHSKTAAGTRVCFVYFDWKCSIRILVSDSVFLNRSSAGLYSSPSWEGFQSILLEKLLKRTTKLHSKLGPHGLNE